MTNKQHTTNYCNTFIQVAEDCPADTGLVPQVRAGKMTVAGLQFAMLINEPYVYTSDEVILATSTTGRDWWPSASKQQRQEAMEKFYSKAQACMRCSALGKQYGWGIHADAQGRLAIFAVNDDRYRELALDTQIKQLKALRTRRA